MKNKSKKQLASEYNISTKTLKKWIKPILKNLNMTEKQYNNKKIFTPNEVKIIYEFLGEP